MSHTITVAIFMLYVQTLYLVIWTIATYGYATNQSHIVQTYNGKEYNLNQCTTYSYANTFDIDGTQLSCNGNHCQACFCDGSFISNQSCFTSEFYIIPFIYLLFSLIWTTTTFSNIVHCTTAGTVSKWWEETHPNSNTTKACFIRSVTTSLGSICFGSMLSSTIRTVRLTIKLMYNQFGSIPSSNKYYQVYIIEGLQRLLNFLDRIIVYFNRYAYCFIGMCGYDFIRASKGATALFQKRGLSTLFNDEVIETVLNVGSYTIAISTMLVGYYYAKWMELTAMDSTLLGLLGFFTGYTMSLITTAPIYSAVATVTVSFIHQPDLLQTSHPELHDQLIRSWMKINQNEKVTTMESDEPASSVSTKSTSEELLTKYAKEVQRSEEVLRNKTETSFQKLSSSNLSTNSNGSNTIRGSYNRRSTKNGVTNGKNGSLTNDGLSEEEGVSLLIDKDPKLEGAVNHHHHRGVENPSVNSMTAFPVSIFQSTISAVTRTMRHHSSTTKDRVTTTMKGGFDSISAPLLSTKDDIEMNQSTQK